MVILVAAGAVMVVVALRGWSLEETYRECFLERPRTPHPFTFRSSSVQGPVTRSV
jgi:hypothetical protein